MRNDNTFELHVLDCTSALTTSTMHMKTVLPTLYRSATLLRPPTCIIWKYT